ncbi:hypothetical protein BSKO_02263 [Bryopsis sp. KO-2023]|nr:hypothetical protein BSKO_02263 [Bryopsis sp. KO-2023]
MPKVATGGCSKYMELAFIPEPSRPQPEPQAPSSTSRRSSLEDFFNPSRDSFVHEQIDLLEEPREDDGAREPAGMSQDEMGWEQPHPSKEIPGLDIAALSTEPSPGSDTGRVEDSPMSLAPSDIEPWFPSDVRRECFVSSTLETEPSLSGIGEVRACLVSHALDSPPCLPGDAGRVGECLVSPVLEIEPYLPDIGCVEASLVSPALDTHPCLPSDAGHVEECLVSPVPEIEPYLPDIGQVEACLVSPAPGTQPYVPSDAGHVEECLVSPVPEIGPCVSDIGQVSPCLVSHGLDTQPCLPSDVGRECLVSPVLEVGPCVSDIGQVEACLVSPAPDTPPYVPSDAGEVGDCLVSPPLETWPCLPGNTGRAGECLMSPGTYAANCAMNGPEEINSGSPDSCAHTEICLLGNEMVTYTVDEFMRESSARELNFGGYLPGPPVQPPGKKLWGMGIGDQLPSSAIMEAEEGPQENSWGVALSDCPPSSDADGWLEETPWNPHGASSSGCLPSPTVEGWEGVPSADMQVLEDDRLSAPSEMDSILQRLLEQDSMQQESPQSQGAPNGVQWFRPPAKLIGLDPGPIVPSPSPSMELAECSNSDASSVEEDEMDMEGAWQDIPGVQLYENEQLDSRSVELFKSCQAEYRRILNKCTKTENVRVKHCKGNRRPDLRAMQELPHSQWLNEGPIIGHVPGLSVNAVFEYKAEMHVLGVHKGHSRGISYLTETKAKPGIPVAFSVCMSSQYEYDENGFFEAWYTGEGGNFTVFGKKKEKRNQALTRGNEALCNSMRLNLPVRVIKKMALRHYVYDGLWDVIDIQMAEEAGKVVYRFKLRRQEMQHMPLGEAAFFCEKPPPLQIDCTVGEIVNDLSCGREQTPIAVVNTVDWELAPGLEKNEEGGEKWVESIDQFVYGTKFSHSENVVDECGMERPLYFRLQVFRKSVSDDSTGWGVRAMEHIPAESYIVTYMGKIMHLKDDYVPEDDVFCHDLPLRAPMSDAEDGDMDYVEEEITHGISSASYGNVSRFIDHSESPNCVMRGVFSKDRMNRLAQLWIYALTEIQPGEEITFHHYKKVECQSEDGYSID